jgi:hypothetical protein
MFLEHLPLLLSIEIAKNDLSIGQVHASAFMLRELQIRLGKHGSAKLMTLN